MVRVKVKNPSPLGLLVVNGSKRKGTKMARKRKTAARKRTTRRSNPSLFRGRRRFARRRRNPSLSSTSVSGNPIMLGVIGTLGGAGVQAIVGLLGGFGGTSIWADIGRTIGATIALQLGLEKVSYTRKYASAAALGGWFIVGAKAVSALKLYLGVNIPGMSNTRGMGDMVHVPVQFADQFYGTAARAGLPAAPPPAAAGMNGIVLANRLNY